MRTIRAFSIGIAMLGLTLGACGDDDTTPTGGNPGGGGAVPTVVGSVDLPDNGSGVAVTASHAFIATSGEGLQVVDIADKTAPSIVAGLNTIFAAGGVTLSTAGNVAYLCANAGGFHVVDVSDPLLPSTMTTVNTSGTAIDVAITNEASPVLCVADGVTGVLLYYGSSGESSVDTPELATGVAVTADYCFATDVYDGIGTPAPAMHVINITSPGSPVLVTSLPLSGSPAGISIAGNHAYIAAGDPGMYVVDISNPASPSIVGQTGALPATGAIAADPARELVYLGTTDTAGFANDGLKIINVSNPSSPSVVATLNLPDRTTGVAVLENHVYAVTADILGPNPSTLQIIDVSMYASR